MGKYKLPWNNFVPQTFGDAVAYEQQIKYLAQRLQKIEEEGMPTPDLTDLKRRVTELETEVLTIQNELQELDVEAVTARLDAVDEAITALETEQAAQSVEVTSHGNRLTTLESTVETQQGTVDNLSGRVATTDQAVNRLADDLTQVTQAVAGKQDKLTAGANITIENNVISSTGGVSVILDTEVTEDSQHAVTSEGIYNAIETAKSTIQTAHTADITRIDGELNTKATTASVTTLRGDMEDEIERVEGDYQDADTALDTRLTAVETAQTTTEGNVTTLQQNVTTLQQTQTAQGTTLTGLGNRMTTAEGNITQLQTDTSQLSGTVQGMQTTIQGKQDKLTAGANITIENNIISSSGGGGQVTLDDTVTETSSNGVKSSGIYTAIETAKSGLQESITDIDGRVDTLEADNTTNKSNISTLQSSVASAQDDIGALQTGLQQEARDREAADQALRVSINGNSSAITQLQTDVAGKQDHLTAGDNIMIQNNVISALSSGGAEVKNASTTSEYEQQRLNYWGAFSCNAIMNLIQVPQSNSFMINTGKFVVPIFSGTGSEFESEFVQVNTQTIWAASLPAQIQEHAMITSTFGNPTYTEVTGLYMYGMWNEWVGVNRSTISDGLYNATTQGITYSDDSLDITDIPLYPKCPNDINASYSEIYPPKILKGYCVWIYESGNDFQAYPLGIMLVELKNIPAHTHSEFRENTPLTANYKCVKWISVNSTYTGTGFGNRKAQEFLITPIF